MQQPTPAFSAMPTNPPPSSITTEQIQKYLDENKQLIRAILDNQNLGKLSECAQYQALLQKNLLFLAAIADAQPQPPATRPQMMPHGVMQQGGNYMQQQQPPIFPMRPSFNPQQLQEQQLQLQHLQPQLLPFQGSMGLRPGTMNGMHAMQAEASQGGVGSTQDAGSGDPESAAAAAAAAASAAAAAVAAADGYRSSMVERGSRKGEQAQIERVENTKS